MTSHGAQDRADLYERLVELADEADWYHDEHQDAAEHAQTLHRQATQATTGAERRRLLRLSAAQTRHAALAQVLAAQAQAQRDALLAELPEAAPDIIADPGPEPDRRTELGLRLHDALAREVAAADAADEHFAEALAALPWQRTRRETALLRGRYAEACVQAHAATARLVRDEIDALVRERLGLP